MSPEQIQALASFLGVEATQEAVYAALTELISTIEASMATASDSSEMVEDEMDEFRSVREALNLPDNAALVARLQEYARAAAPAPAFAFNIEALRSADAIHQTLRDTDTRVVTPRRPAHTGTQAARSAAASNRYSGFNINTGKGGNRSLISEINRIQRIQSAPVAARAGQNSMVGPLGGHAVDVAIADEIIAALRPKLVLRKAGVREIPMQGLAALTMPKGGTRGQAYWVGQGRTIPISDEKFENIKLTPKKVARRVVIPNDMLANMSSWAESYVRDEVAFSVAEAIDLAGLYGAGTVTGSNTGDEPLGLFNTTGVTKTALGTGNGAAPTVDDLIRQRTYIKQANVNLTPAFGHVMSPTIAGYYEAISDTTGQPNTRVVRRDGMTFIDGDPAHETTLVESDVTLGTSTDTGHIFIGEWSKMLMGMGINMEMLVDPYSLSSQFSTVIIVAATADFAVEHTEAFRILTGVRNTA